ncbi:hypothetical protein AMATHDRAFT_64142 [Amanita thiersii Skay4041]|uniref:Uncharacterized protein n=1 Tax=Amanita thiersii Skay4041 TaxID=703135 RepID=A0A2A9NEB1_9AGAR|nr:hypothetical protein AMATHDRAFT_64142 [Amanita thiersii Skay4041]
MLQYNVARKVPFAGKRPSSQGSTVVWLGTQTLGLACRVLTVTVQYWYVPVSGPLLFSQAYFRSGPSPASFRDIHPR